MAIKFVEVVEVGPGWNKVLADDGNVYTLKGDYNWRSNNPGNIEYGPFAISMGAIGSGAVPPGRKRGFAIFPDYETGQQARIALQFESPKYKDRTVRQAITRYAPPSENDTEAYIAAVTTAAGVSADTKMSDLTPKQREAFLAAQQRVEGFRPGKIRGEDGKSVPPEVVQQFKGKPLPPLEIGASKGAPKPLGVTKKIEEARKAWRDSIPKPLTASQTIADKRAAFGKTSKTPIADAAKIKPLTFDKKTPQAKPEAKPAPAKKAPKTAVLPSGKTIEVGRIYTVNGRDYIGGVDDNGAGVLKKAEPGLIGAVTEKSILGDVAREEVRKGIAQGTKTLVAEAPKAIDNALTGVKEVVGGLGQFLGNAFGADESTPTPKAPVQGLRKVYAPASKATAQQIQAIRAVPQDKLARDVAEAKVVEVATAPKAPVKGLIKLKVPEAKPKATAPAALSAGSKLPDGAVKATAKPIAGAKREAKISVALTAPKSKVVKELGWGEVAPKGTKAGDIVKKSGAAAPPRKEVPTGAALGLVPGVGLIGARNALTVEKPKPKVSSSAPATTLEMEIKKIVPVVEKGLEDLKTRLTTITPSPKGKKITEVGGGGAYVSTDRQESQLQITENSLLPKSMNTDNWTKI